jgi:hypothetical protein
MSDSLSGSNEQQPIDGRSGSALPEGYEPPRLTRVGNVRDLLAGNGGTSADSDPTADDLQLS